MKFKGSIIITDPCYIVKDDDWDEHVDTICFDDGNLDCIGFENNICNSTLYGDWSCTTFSAHKSNPKELRTKYLNEDCETPFIYGQFCADAGMVCVCYVTDVMKYNPEFFTKYGKWYYTLIPDFDGEIEYCVENDEAFIIGIGNKNFFTCQTGM